MCPAQLHPNGWAFMQAFIVLCTGLLLTPTPASYLYFFQTLPHPNKSGEGASSLAKKLETSVATPSWSVNAAAKISSADTPTVEVKPANLEVARGKSKRKPPQEKTPSPPKKRKLTTC